MVSRRPKVIVAPVGEPLTIEDCRAHLNLQPYDDTSDGTHPDDELIMAMQGAAREHCENFLGLSLSRRTLEIALDKFPAECDAGGAAIELPFGPVVQLLGLTQGTGSDDEVDPAGYTLDTYGTVARLVPVDAWPTVTAAANLVRVRYLAGYGEDSDGGEPLPKAIRAALLLMLGSLYEQREDATEKALTSIPSGVHALLRPLRVRLGMA